MTRRVSSASSAGPAGSASSPRQAKETRQEVISSSLHGERVDRAVALLTGLSRSQVAVLVAEQAIRVGGETVDAGSRRLNEGEVLEVDLPAARALGCQPDPSVVVPLIHVDEHVLVADKPAGLVVHPGAGHSTGTLAQGLLARFPELAEVGDPERPGIVHRLDRDTSGLLVVARSARAYASLTAQLARRTVERLYLALAWGHPHAQAGVIDAPVGRAERDPTRMAVSARGRDARTRFAVLACFSEPAEVALIECRLETGRTHQIRVHLAAVGHPIVGDARYGGGERPSLQLSRPFLHAHVLSFDHPVTAQRCRFESPLPDELAEVYAGLR